MFLHHSKYWVMKIFLFGLLLLSNKIATAQVLPPDFVDETVYSSPKTFIGLVIDNVGRIFVWEKEGMVWMIQNGIKSSLPVLDITEKTYGVGDLGLISFILDPNFTSNGFVYVSYSLNPSLIPNHSSLEPATYGIVSRFTVDNHLSNSPSVNPNSELILLGQNNKGIPITYLGHMGGALAFGEDGTLMITAGDGGFFDDSDDGDSPSTYHNAAINLGIMSLEENIGANRSQLNESISGKLLRINPISGEGISTNPLYNPAEPNSTVSKVWSKGFRNPWTMLKIPNSGGSGYPGKFFVGDVGTGIDEELNLVHESNLNFGWPKYEGIDAIHWLRPIQYTPDIWEKPKVVMRDEIFGLINNQKYVSGSPELPGDNVGGNGSILLGDFNKSLSFPADYRENLYFGDYTGKNIYRVKFDLNYNPLFVFKFVSTGKYIFGIKVSPIDGSIYYVSSDNPYGGEGELHKISYLTSNNPPVSKIVSNATGGGSKLTVQFDGKYSYDPDGDTLTYSWSFSDGQSSSGLSPFVTLSTTSTAVVTITATLTVTDNHGSTGTASKTVQLNNNAPSILETTIEPTIAEFIVSGSSNTASFSATINDENPNNVTYTWQTFEVHNGHEHLVHTAIGNPSQLTIPTTVCSPPLESYWAKIKLTITDQYGLESSKELIFSPSCGLLTQNIVFPAIPTQTTANNYLTLEASTSSGLSISYYVMNGLVNLVDNNLQFLGIPGAVTLRATQHGDAVFDQAKFQEVTFDYLKNRNNQIITFETITTQMEPYLAINPVAFSSLGKPINYVWISGPINIVGTQIVPNGEPGWATVRAFNSGDSDTNGAYRDQSFYICPNEISINEIHKVTDSEILKLVTAKNVINTTSKVEAHTKLVYNAGKEINFSPGFEVKQGAVFESLLVGCPN